MGLTNRQKAARKAVTTRKERIAVGFYEDKGKTRPVTKSAEDLRRKKLVQKPREFKGVGPRGEKRTFIIHGRKYSVTKSQLVSELGCPPSQVDKIWRSMKKKKWAQKAKETGKVREGKLTAFGYDPHKSELSRHMALNRSIKQDGLETTRKRIQYLANVTPDDKKLDKVYKRDLAWLKTKKGMQEVTVVGTKARASAVTNTDLKQGGASVYRLPALRTWRRQSKSSPNTWYTIRLNKDGSLSCNCKGWIFSTYPKGCTHTREVHATEGAGGV